jgi:type II secretory pathway component PulC
VKKKHLLLIPSLVIMVAAIWTINVILLRNINTGAGSSNPDDTSRFSAAESLAVTHFIFRPLKRDPFNIVVDTVPHVPMPRCILRGVVMTGDGAVALMELSDANIYPMKKGDVYKGVKIKNITPDWVILQFRGRTDTVLIMP